MAVTGVLIVALKWSVVEFRKHIKAKHEYNKIDSQIYIACTEKTKNEFGISLITNERGTSL